MIHYFSQLDDGVSADVETASAFEKMAVAMALLTLLLQVSWRCYRLCYCDHVKNYLSFSSSSACGMEPSKIAAVENILKYTFKNKDLLVEALTHSSFSENMSYERLEFLGDAALGLAVAAHFFRLEQRKLTPGQLTKLRNDSVCNEKLARMAALHGLYWFVRRKNTASLDNDVTEYEEVVKHEHVETITDAYPDILADIVESLAGAVYVDVDFDLKKLWMIFREVLEVDEIMLPKDGGDGTSEITGAQQKLYRLCGKRKWLKPVYREVKGGGCEHEKKFVYSVEIEIENRIFRETGDEKSSKADARNSAAYLFICSHKNLLLA